MFHDKVTVQVVSPFLTTRTPRHQVVLFGVEYNVGGVEYNVDCAEPALSTTT